MPLTTRRYLVIITNWLPVAISQSHKYRVFMAKKSNRSRPKQTAKKPTTAKVETVEPATVESLPPVVPEAKPVTRPRRSQPTAERMEDEYAYIVGDLRRVLILAAIMFALLIAANLILSRMVF